MSVHMIYLKDGVKYMRPVHTREEYLALRNGGEQRQTLAAIRNGNEGLKHRLVQMNYSCLPNDDGTLKGAKRMSTTVGMDIDHLKAEEMATVKERILQKKAELGLLMLEESARQGLPPGVQASSGAHAGAEPAVGERPAGRGVRQGCEGHHAGVLHHHGGGTDIPR